MMIVAIDPGAEESGWCVLEGDKPVAHGKDSNQEMLIRCRHHWLPHEDVLALEGVQSFGMPVGASVFSTVLWVGRFMEAWESRGGKVHLIYRKDVKMFHCHSMRANDSNIRAAIIDRFGPGRERAIGYKARPGPLHGVKGDAWSALAIALTVHGAQSENALQSMQAAA